MKRVFQMALLSAAAGLVAMAGAQAADIPAKAVPANGQYMSPISFDSYGACELKKQLHMSGINTKDVRIVYFGTATDKIAILVDSAFGTKQKNRFGMYAEGAGLGLKQKLMSSASYIGTPARGFANIDALLYVQYMDKSKSAPI